MFDLCRIVQPALASGHLNAGGNNSESNEAG
jgi:hypothetical protein